MTIKTPKITPFLWFDSQAEPAASFYTSIFPNSRIENVTRYDAASAEVSGRPQGSVMTVAFQLEWQPFVALNGGPEFRFTEAVSFVVNCDDQEEVDYYWEKLSEGGDPAAQQCGWMKDKFGLSWQVVPKALGELLNDPEPVRAGRVMQALLRMKKIDVAALYRARDAA